LTKLRLWQWTVNSNRFLLQNTESSRVCITCRRVFRYDHQFHEWISRPH